MGTSLHSKNGCWAKRRQFSRQKCDGTLQLDGTVLWPILVELSFKIHNQTEQISGKQYQLHKIVTKHHHFECVSIDLYGDHSQSFQTKNVTDTLTTTYPES